MNVLIYGMYAAVGVFAFIFVRAMILGSIDKIKDYYGTRSRNQ